MIKIPADGKLYTVVSWSTFIKWRNRAVIGYAIMATAMSLGLYFFAIKARDDTISQINFYARNACLAGLRHDSPINKYNDFVQDAIKARQGDLVAAEKRGDKATVSRLQQTIVRYENDLIVPPTPTQCKVKILHG